MDAFQNLTITLEPDSDRNFTAQCESLFSDIRRQAEHCTGWGFNEEWTTRQRKSGVQGISINRLNAESQIIAWVSFAALPHEKPTSRVTAIVPAKIGDSLDKSAYNAILNDFHREIVEPVLNLPAWKEKATVSVSSPEVTAETLLPIEVVNELRSFAARANAFGWRDPYGEEHWRKIIISLHRQKKGYWEEKEFQRLLIEEFGFSPESARELVSEYIRGIELLKDYDDLTHAA